MAAGDPTNTVLCSGTTNGNTLPDYTVSEEEREITIDSPVELTSGTLYGIVIKAQASEYANRAFWESYGLGEGYAGGEPYVSINAGTTWSDGFYERWFKTKTGEVEKDTNTPVTTAVHAAIYGNTWEAQTFTASSTYTISSVILNLSKQTGASPGTLTVYITTTVPVLSKPVNPTPTDAATDVTLDQTTITWEDGGGATSYDVYYGDTSGDLTLLESGTTDLSYTISGIALGSPFGYVITRYWRIDAVNAGGTITGDEWSFTTIRLDPPTVTYWYSVSDYYYQLLVQPDGSYGDPPPTGTENVDYVILAAYLPNFIRTQRKLVAAANNKIWYEAT